MKTRVLWVLGLALAGGCLFDVRGQDAADSAAEADSEPKATTLAEEIAENAKALKYHSVLVKRPSSGYLFDRFFAAWLEGGSVEGLEMFLEQRSAAAGAVTGDRLLLAFFHVKQGEDNQALKVFAEALEADPKNAEAWLEKARAEARTLDFDSALEDLKKADQAGAADDDEQMAEVGQLRGRLLVRLGRSEEALEVWRALLAARADDEDLHEDVIELLVDEGLYDEAISTAKKLAEATEDPYQKVQRQLTIGDLHQRAGNREDALAAYSGALGKTGHGTWIEREILAQLEQLFRREDDIDGLSIYLEGLLKDDGKRMALRQRRASALVELGEDDLAIEAWKEILELTPGERAIREGYVAVLAKMERFKEAVAQMKALTELHAEDGELKVALAELQHAAGGDEAVAAATTVLDFLDGSDKSEYAHLRAARLLQRFEQNEQAEEVYGRLLAGFPDSAGAKETFANFLHDLKRRDEALKIWRELAATDDVGQVVRVGRALSARGEADEAFALVRGRFEDLKNDKQFLAQLVELALRAKETDEAFDWVRRQLLLVESGDDLVDVTSQALLVVRQTGEEKKRIEELRGEAAEGDGLSVAELALLSELLHQAGDFDAALAVLDEIVGEAAGRDEDDRLLALAQKSRLYVLRKDWAGAAETLRVAVELPGGRKSSTVQMLVDLYQRAAMTEEALHWIGEWKKISPGGTGPWLREATVRLTSGDIETGLKTLRAAARRFEDSEEIRLKLADALVDSGKVVDAERIYWQLYDEAEDSLKKLNWAGKLGELASQSGRLDQLVDLFKERKRRNRGSVVPLLALAAIYQVDDRYEERREAILEASRLQPNDIGLLHQLAGIDEAEGNLDGALKSLNAALEIDPSGRTRQRIVRLHFLSGEYEKGLEALQAGSQGGLVAADPYLVEEVWASIVRTGEWERASSFLRPFLSAQPENYRLQYLYAVALEEGENPQAAREAFVALLDFDKEVPPPANSNPNANQQRYVMYGGSYYNDPAQLERAKREMEQTYPLEAIAVQEMSSAEHKAYHYRQGRGEGRIYGFGDNQRHYYGGWGGGYGVGSTLVMPPPMVEEVRAFAFPHLMKIGRKLAEDEAAGDDGTTAAAEITELAKRHGFPSLLLEWEEFTRDSEELPQEEQQSLFSRFMKKHPDSEVVHALWLMGWMSRGESEDIDSLAEAQQVFEMFREDRPALAFFAALTLVNTTIAKQQQGDLDEGEADTVRKNVDEALALLPNIDYVPTTYFHSLYGALNSDLALRMAPKKSDDGDQDARQPLLTEAQSGALEKLLAEWGPEISARYSGSQQSGWFRMSLLSLTAMKGDMEALIKGLETEIADHREKMREGGGAGAGQQQNQQTYDPYTGRSYGSVMVSQALTFPPPLLPDLPVTVLGYMGPNRGGYSGATTWRSEENLKKVAALLPEISDPVLRVMFAHLVGEDGEKVKAETLAELAEADPPTASGLMLAAAHASTTAAASVDEDADKEAQKKAVADAKDQAAISLEKARHLTALKPILNYIDAALVDLGTGAEEDSIRFEKGKTAALRIRSLLKPDQSSEIRQLAEALRRFGLDKEASRLSLSLTRTQSAQSRASSVGGTALSAMTQAQDPDLLAAKLKQLVEQDKRDTAVTTAVRQIKLIASGLLGEQSSYLEYQLRELRQELDAASLTDEIIENAKPKEGAKLVERVQFAALCEAVGDQEKAVAAYQKLIEERPKDDALRLRLIVLLTTTDPEAAFEELAELKSQTMLAQIGQTFANRLNYAQSIEEKISIGELTLKLFESRRDDFPEGQLYWLTNIHNELTGDLYSDNLRLPSLLIKWKKEDYDNYDGYTEEFFDKWMKKRTELHKRYCETMMTMPMQASHGFTSHAVVRAAAGDSLESLAERAREVLKVMEKPAFHGIGYSYSPTGSNWGGGGDREKQLPIQGPIEVLVAHAYERKDRSLIYDELLPELEKDPKKKSLADGVRAYADLYFCEPGEFSQAIDDIKKLMNHYGPRLSIRLGADAYSARDIDFDFAAKLKEMLKDPNSRNNSIEDVLPELMVATAERGGTEGALELMEVYAEQMLGPGPAEARRDYIKKHYVANSWSGNTPNGDIHSFEEFIGNCGRYPELVFAAVRIASELKLGANGRIYQLEYPFTDSNYAARPEYVTKWLENSPLRNPLAELNPMSAGSFQRISQNGRHTVLGAMLYNLGRVAKDKRKPIEDYIKVSGDPASAPFGVRLISSRWEKNPSLAAAKIFHQAAGEIREMTEEKQILLASLATDLIEPDKLPGDLDGSVAESWKWYEELAGAGADDQLDDFLAADSAADLGIRDYQIDDRAEALIKRVIGQDVDKALEAFAKALELIDKARATGGYRSSYSGGRTVGGELLDDISQAAQPLDALRFEMGILASEKIPSVTIFSQPKRDKLGPKLLGDARNKEPEVQLTRFREVFADLTKALAGPGETESGKANPAVGHVLVMPVFYGFFNSCKEESMTEMLKWIDEQIAADQSDIEFLLAARTAALQVQTRREFSKIPTAKRKKKRADSNPVADQWFVRILSDRELPANLRLCVSYNAVGKGQPRGGNEVVAAAASLLVESWNGDTPVVDGQAQPIIEEWIARKELSEREKIGREIAAAFQTRYVSGRAPMRLQGNPDSRLVLAMVKLNLSNGNSASANQILSRFDQRFSDFTEPFALLVRAGESASAARLLRKNQEKVAGSFGPLTWDAELAAATPAFLKTITRTETRLLAHAVLAAAPDEKKPKAAAEADPAEVALTTRADRLADVAESMAKSHEEVGNSLIREQILRLIALEPKAIEPAAEIYAAELAKTKIPSLFQIDDSTTRSRRMAVIDAALLHTLMKGQPEPYASMIVEAAPAPSSSSYYKRQFMNRAVRLPHKAIVESGHDPEVFSALLPAWSEILLEVPMSDRVGPAKTIMGALLFDAVECDRLDEFYAWFESHEKKSRGRLAQNIREAGAGFYKAAGTVYKDQERSLDDKQALVERWYGRPELTKTGIGLGWSNFIAASNNRFITIDEIVERGAKMAEKSTRRGQAWADVATAHDRKKLHQEALEFWTRAIEVAVSEKREPPAHRYMFGKANSLSKLGQKEDARSLVEKVFLKHVPKFQRKAYDTLRKELKMEPVTWPKEEKK